MYFLYGVGLLSWNVYTERERDVLYGGVQVVIVSFWLSWVPPREQHSSLINSTQNTSIKLSTNSIKTSKKGARCLGAGARGSPWGWFWFVFMCVLTSSHWNLIKMGCSSCRWGPVLNKNSSQSIGGCHMHMRNIGSNIPAYKLTNACVRFDAKHVKQIFHHPLSMIHRPYNNACNIWNQMKS